MSRPSRIYAVLNPLMRMTSIEGLAVHIHETQRREDQDRTSKSRPRRTARAAR